MITIDKEKPEPAIQPMGNRWQPLSVPDAQALWQRLELEKKQVIEKYSEQIADLWILGESGNETAGISLLKDGRVAITGIHLENPGLPPLPGIGFATGHYSLFHCLAGIGDSPEKELTYPEISISRIPARLKEIFIHLATRPEPKTSPLEQYESQRETLSIKAAEAIAEGAFRMALASINPRYQDDFADQWAPAALSLAMGGTPDLSLLTGSGAEGLRPLCTQNVHRTLPDFVAEEPAIDQRLNAQQNVTRKIKARKRDDERPYLNARLASTAAVLEARGQLRNHQANNLKPFSQRFIKGLVLAKVTRARLAIGSLSDAISGTLAGHFGEALASMQDTEIVVTGRTVPELTDHEGTHLANGIYQTADFERKERPRPRIVLCAKVAIIDPRIIYHELQHARQYSAGEEPIRNLKRTGRYETEVVEWKAKQAEAEFTTAFGILY